MAVMCALCHEREHRFREAPLGRLFTNPKSCAASDVRCSAAGINVSDPEPTVADSESCVENPKSPFSDSESTSRIRNPVFRIRNQRLGLTIRLVKCFPRLGNLSFPSLSTAYSFLTKTFSPFGENGRRD